MIKTLFTSQNYYAFIGHLRQYKRDRHSPNKLFSLLKDIKNYSDTVPFLPSSIPDPGILVMYKTVLRRQKFIVYFLIL